MTKEAAELVDRLEYRASKMHSDKADLMREAAALIAEQAEALRRDQEILAQYAERAERAEARAARLQVEHDVIGKEAADFAQREGKANREIARLRGALARRWRCSL